MSCQVMQSKGKACHLMLVKAFENNMAKQRCRSDDCLIRLKGVGWPEWRMLARCDSDSVLPALLRTEYICTELYELRQICRWRRHLRQERQRARFAASDSRSSAVMFREGWTDPGKDGSSTEMPVLCRHFREVQTQYWRGIG